MKKISCFYHFLVLFLVGLDQLSKFLVVTSLFLFQRVEIIPGFFGLTRIHNRGVIFGAFSHLQQPAARIILTLISLLALIIVFIFYLKTPLTEKMIKLSFTFILAGAIGNLLDRLIRGYVVDFIDLHLGRHHWPFFNLADTCITVGGVMLIIFLFIPQRRKECSLSS
jgi:signal peptidase II